MKELNKESLNVLLLEDAAPCVSVYIPLGQIELDKGVASTCVKRLYSTVEELLIKSHNPKLTQMIMKVLKGLKLAQLTDKTEGSLVLFISPSLEGYFVTEKTLKGMAVVAESFHIKPILEYFLPNQDHYVLSLSGATAHVFKGNAKEFKLIHTFAVDYEKTYENLRLLPKKGSRFFHALQSFVLTNSQKFKDYFAEPVKKKFYLDVDKQMRRFLRARPVPVILAGNFVDVERFKKVNMSFQVQRLHLKSAVQLDNSESIQKTHRESQKISSNYYKHLKSKSFTDIKRAQKSGVLKVGLGPVVDALRNNAVETLYVNRDELIWGKIDWRTGHFNCHPFQVNGMDDDLIDDCIEKALLMGVKIVPIEKSPLVFWNPLMVVLKKEPSSEEAKIYAFTPLRTGAAFT